MITLEQIKCLSLPIAVYIIVNIALGPAHAAKLEAWKIDCMSDNIKVSDAITACSTSLRSRRIDPRYLVQRGSLWLHLKDYDYAISDYTRAIDQGYGGIMPLYGRAAAYIGSDMFIDAMLDIQTIMVRSMPDIILYKAIDRLLSWETGRQIQVVYVEERNKHFMQPVKRRKIMVLYNKIDLSDYFIGIPALLILSSFIVLSLL